MDYQDIQVEISDRVAIISLQKPESGNTISDARIIEELETAIGAMQASNDVSVLILTGSGKIFSAGGNVKAMRDHSGMFNGEPIEVYENYRGGVQRITRLMAQLDLVTLAAVNGTAIGAGCDLALMCDLRIAARSARFGQGFVNLGIIPGDGGAWFLARTVPRHIAADLIFSGRLVGAEEALQMGLVNEVVDDEQLLPRAREIAAVIAGKPPLALKLSKRLLNKAYEQSLPDYLDTCAAYQSLLHPTADHREALAAFFEKRPGKYQGK
ncbi:enoyl-CoA hydratase/isomerase family protein [candidate division KSB1 bacterium]|nr:enoyl-CoA hydratase/isomerase family protein [candidate division KSB1 bacterium]